VLIGHGSQLEYDRQHDPDAEADGDRRQQALTGAMRRVSNANPSTSTPKARIPTRVSTRPSVY
jgi:hypothetical protein